MQRDVFKKNVDVILGSHLTSKHSVSNDNMEWVKNADFRTRCNNNNDVFKSYYFKWYFRFDCLSSQKM